MAFFLAFFLVAFFLAFFLVAFFLAFFLVAFFLAFFLAIFLVAFFMTAFLRDNVQSGHLEVSAPAKRVDKPAYCADDEMPGEAIRAAYLGWAAGQPDQLDQPAASALFLALAEAFPCSGPPLADASYQSASWHP